MTSETDRAILRQQIINAAKQREPQYEHELRVDGDYADVIAKLGLRLPIDTIIDWFSSDRGSTGNKIIFPYFRVDSGLYMIQESIYKMENFPNKQVSYLQASIDAAQTLSWIEIGWGGLDRFARNPTATRNWTTFVGHTTSPEERTRYIVSEGKVWIDTTMGGYLGKRREYDPIYGEDDIFRQYNIENLLDPYR